MWEKKETSKIIQTQNNKNQDNRRKRGVDDKGKNSRRWKELKTKRSAVQEEKDWRRQGRSRGMLSNCGEGQRRWSNPLDSPYGSIRRPTGAEGGRLGPSIISGGDGAPPLTGEGPYESPVIIKPCIYSRKTSGCQYSTMWVKKRSSFQLSTLKWQMYDHNNHFFI